MLGGVGKLVVGALVGLVVAGAGAWFTLAGDVVTRAQAIDLIEVHSPYIEDRKVLLLNAEETIKLREAVSDLAVIMEKFTLRLEYEMEAHHPEHPEDRR